MKSESKPVKFRQIFVSGETLFALDLNGVLWASNLSANGYRYPPNGLQWVRCAMPPDEIP